ncbi:MAG: hypothetical protein COA79_00665 [Planctomycetota bacterium]|nr:MAG: hypothetical protein COA79_00665 [Planctomycetota bacterium]
MKYKKNQEHLKFTLFPFVSILLATVGVLIFLTMVQAVLIKDDQEEETPKEEENKRTYERIPEFNTHVLRFYKDKITYLEPGKKVINFNVHEYQYISQVIYTSCLLINNRRSLEESDTREHLLYVVEFDGARNYFQLLDFFKKKIYATNELNRIAYHVFPKSTLEGLPLNRILPIGLVLLSKGEGFLLK